MAGNSSDSKLMALSKILDREKINDFQDSTVIGGLDRFLQRWTDELYPVVGPMKSYSILTPDERKLWIANVRSNIDSVIETDGITKAGGHTDPDVVISKSATTRSKKPTRLRLADSITNIKVVTKKHIPKLSRLGLETVEDLLYLFPHRHNDFANVCKISDLELGKDQTVLVTVWEASETRQGPRRRSTQAILGDDTGNVRAIWFNQPYLTRTFKTGTQMVISGKVNVFRGTFVFESPEYELLSGQEELVHTGRLVPVYPTVDGMPQRTLRRIIKQGLDEGIHQIEEFLPVRSRQRTGVIDIREAISQIHYPDTEISWNAARKRLAFDELLTLQLAVLARKRQWGEDSLGVSLSVTNSVLDEFLACLPFSLTEAQSRVLQEILGDLNLTSPMNRLLQGDVGSGKTVVALLVLLVTVFSGFQGAMMAPTEILAGQHFLTVTQLLSNGTVSNNGDGLVSIHIPVFSKPIKIALLLGSMHKGTKRQIHQQISEGTVDIIVGTHALIQDEIVLPKLGLAIVDEQHRFGVMQRALLRDKGERPHILAMSATPIPRSLAFTLYGELDVSVIDEMPKGRQQIRTRWIKPEGRAAAYKFISKQIESGRQAFIICPLIEESEAIRSRAAVKEYERLSTDIFPESRVGLLHGRLDLRDKEQTMGQFQRGDMDIIVATSLIEVGIDVPNATVMLVDGADRFGLAQLHQFRGRVGRGRHQSYCLLLSDAPGPEARERLKLVERIHDGFNLAEEDLRIRGAGDYMGTRQSGLPSLTIASITRDQDILLMARQEANSILDLDPTLQSEENVSMLEHLNSRIGGLVDEIS